MGTYSKFDVKYHDNTTNTFEVKAEADWIAKTVLESELWEEKDGKQVILSKEQFDEFMADELYGWESNPTSCVDYYFYLDCTNLANSYWCKADFDTAKPIGKPRPLFFSSVQNTSTCVQKHIDGISSKLYATTAKEWLEANRNYSFVKGKEIRYHFRHDNLENPALQIPEDIKVSDNAVDIYLSAPSQPNT